VSPKIPLKGGAKKPSRIGGVTKKFLNGGNDYED
jgi:hypothetical protein